VPASVNCVFVAWLYADMTTDSSDDEDAVAAMMFIATVSKIKKCNKRKRKRSVWTKSWISNRLEYGCKG